MKTTLNRNNLLSMLPYVNVPSARALCSIAFAFPVDTSFDISRGEDYEYDHICFSTRMGSMHFDARAFHDGCTYVHIWSDRDDKLFFNTHFAKDEYYKNGVQLKHRDGNVYTDGCYLEEYSDDELATLRKVINAYFFRAPMQLESGIAFSATAAKAFAAHPLFLLRRDNEGRAVFFDMDGHAFWQTTKVVKSEKLGNGYLALTTESGHKYQMCIA